MPTELGNLGEGRRTPGQPNLGGGETIDQYNKPICIEQFDNEYNKIYT
jgi:hypothetical protein